MAERRYDEDETRAIFDSASKVPSLREPGGAPSADRGFTLAELQEIGVEAGLDPGRIAEAARALEARTPAPAPVRRLAGLPVEVARTVVLPGDFDEDDWNRLVVDLRETFGARGRIRAQGAFREWSNGNLQALVEPTDDGHRLRLRTVKGSAYRAFRLGGFGIFFALVLLVAFLLEGRIGDAWLGAAFLGIFGLGSVGLTALQLPGWSRTRARQMEEVASRALLRAGEGAEEGG
jgi:hypothetical protein